MLWFVGLWVVASKKSSRNQTVRHTVKILFWSRDCPEVSVLMVPSIAEEHPFFYGTTWVPQVLQGVFVWISKLGIVQGNIAAALQFDIYLDISGLLVRSRRPFACHFSASSIHFWRCKWVLPVFQGLCFDASVAKHFGAKNALPASESLPFTTSLLKQSWGFSRKLQKSKEEINQKREWFFELAKVNTYKPFQNKQKHSHLAGCP